MGFEQLSGYIFYKSIFTSQSRSGVVGLQEIVGNGKQL